MLNISGMITRTVCQVKRYIIRADYDIMSVAKIVELVGSSNKGWEDAAQVALNEAIKTIHGLCFV